MIPYIAGTVIYNYFMYLLSALSLTINLLKSSVKPSLPCCSFTESCSTLWEAMDCSARPPCPWPSPEVCPAHVPYKVMPSTILSLGALFFCCPQSFQESGTFPMSRLFASDDLLSSVPHFSPIISRAYYHTCHTTYI